MRFATSLALACLSALGLAAQSQQPRRPVHTFSIFAREPFWRRLVPRLAEVGQLPKEAALLGRIQSQ